MPMNKGQVPEFQNCKSMERSGGKPGRSNRVSSCGLRVTNDESFVIAIRQLTEKQSMRFSNPDLNLKPGIDQTDRSRTSHHSAQRRTGYKI